MRLGKYTIFRLFCLSLSDMDEIDIMTDGKLLSRVVSVAKPEDAVPYLGKWPRVYIVYDRNAEKYAAEMVHPLGDKLASAASIETGEAEKAMGGVLEMCGWLLQNGATRGDLLLAIGGGITTDMAGFAAAIYMRGISVAYLPTTLLAQVDAAIGGKNGVNFSGLKNMIGTIRQPALVFECPEVLGTLPYREFACGSAEMLKTFIIDNTSGNYEKAARLLARINGAESRRTAIETYASELGELVHASAAVKAGIVSRDQFESGERRLLNLGHTFAHAIESVAKKKNDSGGSYDIAHGEAVASGIILAATLSEKLGIAGPGLSRKLKNNFAGCGLPDASPFPVAELADAMHSDKKGAGNGEVIFVLPRAIGDTTTMKLKIEKAVELLG